MRILGAILRKELLQLSRNRGLLFLIFACPVIILGIIPFALENNTRISVGIVDHDRSALSRDYATRLVHSPEFTEVRYFPAVRLAEEAIRKGEMEMMLVIPSRHESRLQHTDAEPLKIAIDGTHPQKAQNYVYKTQRLLENPDEQIRVHRLFNPTESQQFYYLVSLLVLVQTLIGTCLIALNIVAEKEAGILEQFNSTSLNRFTYITGKFLFMALVCLAVTVVSLLFCHYAYGLSVEGSVWQYLLMTVLFSYPLLSLGFLLAVVCKNQVQTVYLLIFSLLILVLMSTMFTHLSSMPHWARLTRFFNPVYFMLDISRMIILKGMELQTMQMQILLITGTGVLLSGAAVWRMLRSPERW